MNFSCCSYFLNAQLSCINLLFSKKMPKFLIFCYYILIFQIKLCLILQKLSPLIGRKKLAWLVKKKKKMLNITTPTPIISSYDFSAYLHWSEKQHNYMKSHKNFMLVYLILWWILFSWFWNSWRIRFSDVEFCKIFKNRLNFLTRPLLTIINFTFIVQKHFHANNLCWRNFLYMIYMYMYIYTR